MKTIQQKYDAFYSFKVPVSLVAEWVRAEDEGRDNACTTEAENGKLIGYMPSNFAYQNAFIETIAFVSVVSDYTVAFRKWLAKCEIEG